MQSLLIIVSKCIYGDGACFNEAGSLRTDWVVLFRRQKPNR